jgi:hypothetical protein
LFWTGLGTVFGRGFFAQSSDGHVVDDLLDSLEVIFESVELLPEIVVLEVEQAEPVDEIIQKLRDADWTFIVALGDTVHRETSLKGAKQVTFGGKWEFRLSLPIRCW